MSSNLTYRENTVCLDVPAAFQYLQVVSSCLDGMLAQEANQESSKEERDILSYDVQLAVQEICTNIVRHAYKERANERIRVTITLQAHPQRLVVELFDTGAAFDESQVKEPNLDEGQVHGYGLFIVKNLMDEVVYQRQLDGNFWCLAKKL